MKKSKVSKLIVLLIATMMILSGCSKDASQEAVEEKAYTIGIIQLAEHQALNNTRVGFEDGLKELGVDAQIVYQNAQGDIPNSLSIAQKFASDKVDLILAIATPAAQSAKQATSDIPILFSAVTDPVKSEIVADWKNVGGNITGTSNRAPVAAQLKMFKEIDPSIKKIGVIYNTSESNSEIQLNTLKTLAPDEGLEIIAVGITNVNEIAQALDSLLTKVDAMYSVSDNLVASSIELVSKKLLENKMISISNEESLVVGGLLITNGLSYYDLGKQTAQMAKNILVDGVDISTIPVGFAEKTNITVNQKTLEALGLDVNLPLFKDALKVGE